MSEYEVIPQQAIDALIANPEKAAGFDQVFGKGRSTEVFAAQNPVPAPVEEEDDDWTFLGEAGRAVGGGLRDAAQETMNFADFTADHLAAWITGREATDFAPIIGDGTAISLPEVDANKTIVGGVGRGITQFVAGMAGAGKFTKLTGLKGAFVNGAIADAVVMDPYAPNVTKMLEEFGVDAGPVSDILATDPDDPEYINRLRNVTEGAALGGVVEAIGWSIKAARAAKAGDTQAVKTFTDKQNAALRELDDELSVLGKAVADDARETLDFSKATFKPLEDIEIAKAADETRVEADGQLSLDLGDTPRAAPIEGATATPKRIFLTPERVENIRLQGVLATGAPKAGKQTMFSFRSLDTVADFDDVLDDIAGAKAVLADVFTQIKGGDVQRWSTVKAQAAAKLRQMAEMTGEDPEAVVRKFMSADMGDVTQLAAEVHARSRYVLTVEKELKEMGKAIASGSFDPKQFPGIKDMDHLRLAFQQRREVGANLLAGQDALRTNVARAMNAMKIAVKGDEKLQAMLKDPNVFRDVDAAARAVADPANADASALRTIDDALAKIHGFMDKVNTFRINALLSGPGTQEVNFISNVVNGFVIPAEQALGAAVTGDKRMLMHSVRQFQGYMAGTMDAVGASLKAGWFDDAVLDVHAAKIDTQGLEKATSLGGKVVTLPSRALMTMDEFFKQSQYRGRVFADAHDLANSKGLKGDEKTAFIKQYLGESYDETGAALRGDALLQARRATFTEPLEGGLAAMLQMAAIKHPLIRFIIPFVRTPINILSQTFQHVPIAGALSKRWKADMAAGGARRAQAMGKWMVGSGLIAMAGFMASSGQITGSGPSDPRIRKVWLQNNQPYAFRVDNEDGTVTWVSYARLEPLSNLFSIAADMVEIGNDEFNEASTKGVMESLFMAVMENTVNKTFTQGIYDAMSIMVGSKQYEREAALRNMLASFVPNILNQTNGDDVLRETRDLTDAFMSRTHLYNEVDPKRNVLGEPVVRRLPKYDPLGITNSDRREVDTVLDEVTRVAILNQSVADNPSKRLAGPNRVDLTAVPFTDGQSLYDRWVELTGEVEIGGLTLREKLAQTFEKRSYQTAPDGFVGATSGTKGAIIRKVIGAYREKAKGQLPELVELIKTERKGGATLLRTQVKSNRELFPLTNTPERQVRRRTFEDLLGQ